MRAIGIIETNVIAKGVQAADAMAKAAAIKLLKASPICPGKYLVIIRGKIGDVKSSVEAGIAVAGETVTGSTIIPNVHPDVFPAIIGTTGVETIGAIGVIETYTAPSAILAADESVKSANIQLIDIRLSMALGGKAIVTFTGKVGAVRSALAAGVNRVKDSGLVLSTALIPAPHEDLIKELL